MVNHGSLKYRFPHRLVCNCRAYYFVLVCFLVVSRSQFFFAFVYSLFCDHTVQAGFEGNELFIVWKHHDHLSQQLRSRVAYFSRLMSRVPLSPLHHCGSSLAFWFPFPRRLIAATPRYCTKTLSRIGQILTTVGKNRTRVIRASTWNLKLIRLL